MNIIPMTDPDNPLYHMLVIPAENFERIKKQQPGKEWELIMNLATKAGAPIKDNGDDTLTVDMESSGLEWGWDEETGDFLMRWQNKKSIRAAMSAKLNQKPLSASDATTCSSYSLPNHLKLSQYQQTNE